MLVHQRVSNIEISIEILRQKYLQATAVVLKDPNSAKSWGGDKYYFPQWKMEDWTLHIGIYIYIYMKLTHK